MLLEMIARRFSKSANENRLNARATVLGSQAIAQTELPQVELARSGSLFLGGLQLAANGIAPDATLPTTTAKLVLYNGAEDNGKSLFIDHLHAFLTTGTAAAGMTLWVAVTNGKLGTPVTANTTGWSVGPANGRKAAASAAVWGTAATLPTGTIWHSVGGSFQTAAANFGMSDQPFELRGGICVPPGYGLAFAFLSGAGTTPLYGLGARWAELETDLQP
jgi:hypothetical protein